MTTRALGPATFLNGTLGQNGPQLLFLLVGWSWNPPWVHVTVALALIWLLCAVVSGLLGIRFLAAFCALVVVRFVADWAVVPIALAITGCGFGAAPNCPPRESVRVTLWAAVLAAFVVSVRSRRRWAAAAIRA